MLNYHSTIQFYVKQFIVCIYLFRALLLLNNIDYKILNYSLYYFLEAVASNRYYPKPTREEFQKEVVASLKVAKQRFRNARGRHPGISGNRRNLQAAADALYHDDVNNHEDNINRENNYDHTDVEDVENDSDDSGKHSSNDN